MRALIALKESNAATLKGQAVAGEAMKTEDMYGKAAQPAGLCGSSSLGAGIQLGAQAGREIHAAMREKQLEHAHTPKKPVEFLQRVLAEDQPSERESLDALFPLQSTLTEDQVAQAHEAVKTLANPRPLPVVTEEQKETPAGQTYAAARKIHEERIAAVMESLNNHVVYHAPTLPEDVTTWAENQWSEAGGSGTPPGIVDGKLSEAGLYRLLSQMRVGNPNWFAQIATATDTGLLRELVIMQAFQMAQEHGLAGQAGRHCLAGFPYPYGRHDRQGHGRPLHAHGRRTAVGGELYGNRPSRDFGSPAPDRCQ